jgi:hypothetical protein
VCLEKWRSTAWEELFQSAFCKIKGRSCCRSTLGRATKSTIATLSPSYETPGSACCALSQAAKQTGRFKMRRKIDQMRWEPDCRLCVFEPGGRSNNTANAERKPENTA